MKNHWIVSEYRDTIMYEQVDYVPKPYSSLVLADEIDGLTQSQAVKVLESMFESVKSRPGRYPQIFCKRGEPR